MGRHGYELEFTNVLISPHLVVLLNAPDMSLNSEFVSALDLVDMVW